MDLLKNPFHILNSSPRDNRRRIMELADERSLLIDSSECMEARSDLTTPRKRLSAEVAWLPGIGLKRVREVFSLLESSPADLLTIDNLPSIARVNLLAAGLARLTDHNACEVAKWILEISWAFEDIDPEDSRTIINEERVVSGFPEVTDPSAVESEIQERRVHYRWVIKSALDHLPPNELVEAVNAAVRSATGDGKKHGPILIADLVDSYEVEAQGFLEKEEANIRALVGKLQTAVDAEQPDSTLAPMVNQLIHVVKNWDNVAQPIQVSRMSRGLDHAQSHSVAGLVRDLAIHLFNNHGKLDFSQQITNMLQEVFAEVGQVAERTAQDAHALGEIASNRNKLTSKFKEFNLNGDLFSYNSRTYNINDIIHISCYRAVTTHKTNFIETGKTEKVDIYLKMSGGQEVKFCVDEQGFFFRKDKSAQIEKVVEFYSYLSQTTFDRRVEFYESQIKRNGYFEYDKCYFYPGNKIVFRGREFNRSTSSFFRGYGYVEMRKKDFGILDKIKREASLTKIPQFSTTVDTDVIFHLLDKHFSMRWSS